MEISAIINEEDPEHDKAVETMKAVEVLLSNPDISIQFIIDSFLSCGSPELEQKLFKQLAETRNKWLE